MIGFVTFYVGWIERAKNKFLVTPFSVEIVAHEFFQKTQMGLTGN